MTLQPPAEVHRSKRQPIGDTSRMRVISVQQLARGVDAACFVDLHSGGTTRELVAAAVSAERAQLPLVGFCRGALPRSLEAVAASLTLTLVESESVPSTIAVLDLGRARHEISEQVKRNPTAAAVVVGLLRLTSHAEVEHGLVAESLAYSMLLGAPEFATWRAAVPQRALHSEPDPAVRLERTEDVLTISLHRPHRHNAFNAAMRDGMLEGLTLAELVPAVRVLLRGDGPSFCSGGDLDEFGLAQDLAQAHLLRITRSVGAAVHRLRERVTAHLHGSCIGAGLEIPAFAGSVIADPGVHLQLPELRMGLVPGAGGSVSVCRRIGRWRTAHLVLSGAPIDATTALRWGLVDRIRPMSS